MRRRLKLNDKELDQVYGGYYVNEYRSSNHGSDDEYRRITRTLSLEEFLEEQDVKRMGRDQ